MDDLKFYFPGWTRKSITFSIDDGNNYLDKKFIGYVKPAGIKGTFNLTGREPSPIAEYPDMYFDYEIANHCKKHPFAFDDETRKRKVDEKINFEAPSKDKIYRTDDDDMYCIWMGSWCASICETDKYIELVDEAQRELVEIFGKDRVRGFVWPFGRQKDPRLFAMLSERFDTIRASSCCEDSTNFSFPYDRRNWQYTAGCNNLPEISTKYAEYPDDGSLKFFCLGLHSHDYENSGRWNVLEDFCNKFGNKPQEYYYESVGKLFDYEDAVKKVAIKDGIITNSSDIDVWLSYNGRKGIAKRNSSVVEWQ